ncbi:MAG: Uma2 family endonuclease [Spirochaetota bacterium]
MQVPRKERRYSWSDYLAWPEGERYELIDGVAYAMSPAPRRRRQEMSGEIFRQAANALSGRPCRVYDEAPTVVQPDITVTCDRSKLTEQGMTGPPDLVVEIVSPDSGLIDRRRKFDLYERFGVKEYWMVDQDERVVEVYRLDTDRSYRRSGIFGPEDTVTAVAVPELVVSLAEVFAEEG